MNAARPVEIVGGGLAGLSLGLALQRAGVAVTVRETGTYPRHRVCGEFITGLDSATIAALQLGPVLSGALPAREVGWFVRGRSAGVHRLPSPALALSRHTLDARLADAFVAGGGDLRTQDRVADGGAEIGRVYATGRKAGANRWVGLKVHVTGLALRRELELHLGDNAYVGLTRIENDRVNVCGLFERLGGLDRRHAGTPDVRTAGAGVSSPPRPRHAVLFDYLDACGLGDLRRRLELASVDASSFCAVAALAYERRIGADGRIQIGDACAMIPPFTGHGMAMAFQSAALCVDPLVQYARGASSWEESAWAIRAALRERFATRLGWARALHPFMLRRSRQRWLGWFSRARVLPFRPLYAVLHE